MMRPIEDLVQSKLVHRDVFLEPEIFELEMTRIFGGTWVYLAHESEISGRSTFKTSMIGTQSVIVTRDGDGQLHGLINACRHRGVPLTEAEACGQAKFFVCPYHGWTFDSKGKIVSVPLRDRQAADFNEAERGLIRLPRIESYRGFIFGSLNAAVEPLAEFLGMSAYFIDLFADLSPTGNIRADVGVTKYCYVGNWKQQVENSMDGYHPGLVHQSFFEDVLKPRIGKGMGFIVGPESPAKNATLGNGHGLIDFRMFDRKSILGVDRPKSEDEWHQKIRARLADRPAYAEEVIKCNGGDGFNLLVYPNLVLINNQIRVIRPVRYDYTEVLAYPVTLEDVDDDINIKRIRAHEDFYGPASFGAPDDIEMFQRQWEGMRHSPAMQWLCYDRGIDQETSLDGTGRISHVSDETAHRGIWRRWSELMSRSGAGS
jgi:phenylpropionate dioxygenase-like ring-hydroxylating dioxygenase large terminal subunit